jgi:hypothetical protein
MTQTRSADPAWARLAAAAVAVVIVADGLAHLMGGVAGGAGRAGKAPVRRVVPAAGMWPARVGVHGTAVVSSQVRVGGETR